MSKYAPLADAIAQHDDGVVRMSFREIESILGFLLPDSARRYQAAWLGGNPLDRELRRVGWHAYPRLAEQLVEFRRVGVVTDPPIVAPVERALLEKPDIVLLGCVKSKLPGRHFVRTLYTSTLFQGRMARAEATGAPWFVLSAKYGLLAPDDEIESYNVRLAGLPASERSAWAQRVLDQIDERIGKVVGKTIEIHAGDEYRAATLMSGLRTRGANVTVPLLGMSFGAQLAWYANRNETARAAKANSPGRPRVVPVRVSRLEPIAVAAPRPGVARTLSEDFANGAFDLSARVNAPVPRWESMPEVVAADALAAVHASPVELRTFITLLAAMDRARDADILWRKGVELFRDERWCFDPKLSCQRPPDDLRTALISSGVAQRHGPDTAAWARISNSLIDERCPTPVRRAIHEGIGDASELLQAIRSYRPDGVPWFPFVRGPKISEMWVRMLVLPGRASISNLDMINIAVDVQVRKVTEYLGVTNTGGHDLEQVRTHIQNVWRDQAAETVGPPELAGTAACLDPALWFMGKWGCTFCQKAGAKMPISRVCTDCRFPDAR